MQWCSVICVFCAHRPEVVQRQFDRVLHQAVHLEPIVPEIVFSQRLPLLAGGQLAVGPEERRDVLPAKLGLRLRAVEDVPHDRRDDGLRNVLDGPGVLPRQPVRQGVHRHHDPDPHEAEREAHRLVSFVPTTMWFMFRANPVSTTIAT